MNTPSAGTSSVADSAAHAAFHADRNARVSSSADVDPLPDAPNARTSNTLLLLSSQVEMFLAAGAVGGGAFAVVGGSAGGWVGGAIGGLAGASCGG